MLCCTDFNSILRMAWSGEEAGGAIVGRPESDFVDANTGA